MPLRVLAWSLPVVLVAAVTALRAGRGDATLLTATEARRATRSTVVPPALLLGAAFSESRLSALAAEPGERHWIRLAPWRAQRTPAAAAALLGIGAPELRGDPRRGLEGAALLLDRLGRAAGLGAGDPLERWRPLLRQFSGTSDELADALYADDVLAAAARFADERAPSSSIEQGARDPRVVGVGAVPFWAAAATSHRPQPPSPRRVRYIVVHTMQNDFPTIVEYFRRAGTGVGSHYLVRGRDGFAVQMIDERAVAFHDACFNEESIGIEHEGYVEAGGRWYSDEMYRASAALVRDIARRWDIPLDRAHILGHGETPDCSDHTDPGAAWDWSRYMKYVTAADTRIASDR